MEKVFKDVEDKIKTEKEPKKRKKLLLYQN